MHNTSINCSSASIHLQNVTTFLSDNIYHQRRTDVLLHMAAIMEDSVKEDSVLAELSGSGD
jgi:homoserine kinase